MTLMGWFGRRGSGFASLLIISPFAIAACSSKNDSEKDSGASAGSPGAAGMSSSAGAANGSAGASGASASAEAGAGAGTSTTPGFGWTEVEHDASYDIQAIWGSSSTAIWAAAGGGTLLGGAGQIHYYDGTRWELFYTMATPGFTDAHGVGTDAYIVGHKGQFYRVNLSEVQDLSDLSIEHTAVWAAGPNAVWLGANATSYPVRFWSGERFEETIPKYRTSTLAAVTAIWGTSEDNVWAADLDGLLHYDGTGWTHQPLTFSGSIFGMDGSGPADIWAVGPRTVLHYDGKIWQEVKAGANKGFNDVWVAAPNDAWFVGEAGIIMRGGTGGLEAVESGITEALYAVWGSSPTDVWAGGQGGTLIHYGPTDTPTQEPEREDCNPQGYGCMEKPCCAPFRCTNIGAGIRACQ